MNFTGQIFALDSAVVRRQKLFSSHGGFLTNPVNHHRETIKLFNIKVGRSKPPPVLTSGFNRLKPPRSICQKVVNTGQYESGWSIEI